MNSRTILAHNVSEMCKGALRIPHMPWPDPYAHSLDAYARAVHRSFCDLRFKLIDIMNEAERNRAPSELEPDLLATLTQLAFMARTSGNPTPELIRACEGAEALIGKTMGGAS